MDLLQENELNVEEFVEAGPFNLDEEDHLVEGAFDDDLWCDPMLGWSYMSLPVCVIHPIHCLLCFAISPNQAP